MRTIEYHIEWAPPTNTTGEPDWSTANSEARTEAGALKLRDQFIREWPHQMWRVSLAIVDLIPVVGSGYIPESKLSPLAKRGHDVSTQTGNVGSNTG